MTHDAIGLSIYRLDGRLFVAPQVVSPRGLRGIELFAVEDEPDGLFHALQISEQLALELTRTRPRDKRFVDDQPAPDWSIAGVSSQMELVHRGATKVGVSRASARTEIAFWVPNGHGGLVRTILKEKFRGKPPLSRISDAVTAMFERADRERPRVETTDDLD